MKVGINLKIIVKNPSISMKFGENELVMADRLLFLWQVTRGKIQSTSTSKCT